MSVTDLEQAAKIRLRHLLLLEPSSQGAGICHVPEFTPGVNYSASGLRRNLHGMIGTRAAGELTLHGMGKKKQAPRYEPLPLHLRWYMDEHELTQEELAELLDTSVATVNRYLKGTQNWKQDFLQHAAKRLGVHWLELLPVPEEYSAARRLIELVNPTPATKKTK